MRTSSMQAKKNATTQAQSAKTRRWQRFRRIGEAQNPAPMEHCASNTAADKALKISAEDLQRCRAVLEECRVAVNRTWMGVHIAILNDILERLQEEKKLRKTDIRRMASSLGVPNKINGNTVRLQTLLENVMQVFRQSDRVSPVEGGCGC